MTAAWQTLATAETPEGPLELRRRCDDWLLTIKGRVLMNSFSRSSEEELAKLGVAALGRAPQHVLIGGLGMGFTLRALLDATGPATRVVVAELNTVIVEWCRGPLGPATANAVADPRVHVQIGDVADVIARAPAGSYDLILLDLYEGPNSATQRSDDPFYGAAAIARTRRALRPNGILGVWSEDADAPFARRLEGAGFNVTKHSIGRGGRRHIVYMGALALRAQRSDRRRP
jgi:spermidine synthase